MWEHVRGKWYHWDQYLISLLKQRDAYSTKTPLPLSVPITESLEGFLFDIPDSLVNPRLPAERARVPVVREDKWLLQRRQPADISHDV